MPKLNLLQAARIKGQGGEISRLKGPGISWQWRWTPDFLFSGGREGVWYDPSDAATLFADTAGTVAASIGGTVALMRDKSGRGHHALQSDAAKRPTLLQDAGGRPYLSFNGTSSSMVAAGASLGSTGMHFVAGVNKAASTAVRIFSLGPASAAGEHTLINHSSTETYRFVPRGTTTHRQANGEAVASPARSVVSCGINWNGAAPSRVRVNAGTPVDLAVGAVVGSVPASDLAIGANTSGSGMYWNGGLYALFGVFRSLGDADALAAIAWANGKTAAY